MEIKKNPEVDLRRYRTIFSLAGLSLSLALVLGILHYKQYDRDQSASVDFEYSEDEIDVEQTIQDKPPPPPDEQPPILEVVEDEVEIEPQPEIKSTEDDEEAYVPPPPPPPDDIDNSGEVFESWDVSKKAKFKGDMNQFIANNLVYPPIAVEEGIDGRVTVEFVVEPDGSIKRSSIKILSRPIGFGLEEEAINVVLKMSGMWEAAEQRDRPVRMRFRLPVRYVTQ